MNRFAAILIAIVFACSCQGRVESVYGNMGMDLRNIKYTVVESNEQWMPNGDGEFYARLSFSSASDEAIEDFKRQMLDNGAKELPVANQPTILLGRLEPYREPFHKGYYIIKLDSNDTRNYELLIFDEETEESIIQIEVL